MAGALDGIRIVDQTQVMAGPFASMLLADMGAEVIKVEPPDGEHSRHVGLQAAPGVAASFLAVNRGKKGLTLDLKQPEGVAVLKRLVETADVLVENYRPGVANRLGVDYQTLAAINPRLIYCSVSGFGQTGPYAARGGYDLIAQGMSGIMSATGSEDGPPVKVGVPIADLGAGLFAVLGILCALRARRLTGRGQQVDTSLYEAALALSAWEATEYWYTGQIPKRLGTAHRLNAPYQAFRASDGWINIGGANQANWERIADVLGHPEWRDDPRFATNSARMANLAALTTLMDAVLATQTRDDWIARFDAAGVPVGPVNSIGEALAHPQTLARGMVVDLVHPQAGPVKALGNPVKLSRSPAVLRSAAPVLGADTDAVLAGLGYSTAEVAALRARKVV